MKDVENLVFLHLYTCHTLKYMWICFFDRFWDAEHEFVSFICCVVDMAAWLYSHK